MEIEVSGGLEGADVLLLLFPLMFTSIFVIVGIFLLVKGIKSLKGALGGTKTVQARCVEIVENQRGSEGIAGLYCPIYEYEYEGRYMRASSNEYRPYVEEQVGDYKQIMIDSKHPDVIVTTKQSPITGFILIFMGVSFAGSGLMASLSFLLPTIFVSLAG